MMDDTHEIYKWGGVWRFADFGVATYYVANVDGPDGNALPPVSGGDWRVTAGTSPPPDLVHNCGSDEETGRDVRVAFAGIKLNTCYSMAWFSRSWFPRSGGFTLTVPLCRRPQRQLARGGAERPVPQRQAYLRDGGQHGGHVRQVQVRPGALPRRPVRRHQHRLRAE